MNFKQHVATAALGRTIPVLLLAVTGAVFLAGCQTAWMEVDSMGATYQPSNVYANTNHIPLAVRRVAVLPLTAQPGLETGVDGVEAMEPVLQSELGKSQRFELAIVSVDLLRHLSGQSTLRTDQPLPADFLARIRAETGCDAVLFSRLTSYQPYPPLSIGWKFSLVDCRPGKTAETIWSADESINCGEPDVERGARSYYTWHIYSGAPGSDSGVILHSPRQFGEYTLAQLFSTIPQRQKR